MLTPEEKKASKAAASAKYRKSHLEYYRNHANAYYKKNREKILAQQREQKARRKLKKMQEAAKEGVGLINAVSVN